MLVLSRKLNERLFIGDDVVVTVVAVRGNHVRIGIDAPQSVTIMREELIGREPSGGQPSEGGGDDAS